MAVSDLLRSAVAVQAHETAAPCGPSRQIATRDASNPDKFLGLGSWLGSWLGLWCGPS
ncbi:MAG: hypothetical protein JXR14_10070 [Paracoccaceae bacterium]